MSDQNEYLKRREEAENFYRKIGSVFSPFFSQKISFPSESFNHLIYKNSRNERDRGTQLLRFKLLPLATKLLEISTTHQEFEETRKEFLIKKKKNRIKVSKVIRYWGIIAIINNRKIKVIVRQVGENGQIHFWSVIPAWVTNKYRDIKLFSTMKGNPNED